MVGHFDMRGFNHSLYSKTGYVNKVSFAEGISHGLEFSFPEQIRNKAFDLLLLVGSDPISSLPQSLVKNLKDVPIINIDPFLTPTAKVSKVVLGTALSGLETGGKAIRMDGVEITLLQGKVSEHLSDEEILRQLLNKVGR
jgi:formylmethanofuran dehydrogenase subunit B